MSSVWQKAVEWFHRCTDIEIGDPANPDFDKVELRMALIVEEVKELAEASGVELEVSMRKRPGLDETPISFIAAIDALCDIMVTVIGTAVTWGIDLAPYFEEVMAANMRKVGGPRREDGKLLKPHGWQPPKITRVFEQELSRHRRERIHSLELEDARQRLHTIRERVADATAKGMTGLYEGSSYDDAVPIELSLRDLILIGAAIGELGYRLETRETVQALVEEMVAWGADEDGVPERCKTFWQLIQGDSRVRK